MTFMKDLRPLLRSLAMLVIAIALLPGCTVPVTRHIVQHELAEHEGSRVVAVRTEDGRYIDFRDAGGAIEVRDTVTVSGIDNGGRSVVLRAPEVAEATLRNDETSFARTWGLTAAIGSGTMMLLALVAIAAWSGHW
jgi:hypothetical protein